MVVFLLQGYLTSGREVRTAQVAQKYWSSYSL